MAIDPLDALLERSAPAVRAADPADVHAMIRAAAQEAQPPRRDRRIGILAGVLSLALVGGVGVAGVAASSSSWQWVSGMHPNRSFTYESPTWGQCELRLGNVVAANPFRQFELDRVIDEWFATADVSAEVAPRIGEYLDVIEGSQSNEPEPITDPRLADLNYGTAVDQALGDALHAALGEHGFGTGDVTSSASQVHCEGEDWG